MHDAPGIVCRDCGHGNPEGSRFCGRCGKALVVETVCSGCGRQVPAGSTFCNQCGTPVGAPLPAHSRSRRHGLEDRCRPRVAGGRAQADHRPVRRRPGVDGPRRAARPGVVARLMDRFFQVLADGVHRADGTVDKFTGDGIMALFGAPIAHEDHAQCACRAALEMIDAVAASAARCAPRASTSRCGSGINSGEVVVGSIGDEGEMEYTAIGHTVGLAQRMESMAETGTAYLTGSTAALVEGYFELEALGEREVKGASAPVTVFRARAGRTRPRPPRRVASRGLSSFVGRDRRGRPSSRPPRAIALRRRRGRRRRRAGRRRQEPALPRVRRPLPRARHPRVPGAVPGPHAGHPARPRAGAAARPLRYHRRRHRRRCSRQDPGRAARPRHRAGMEEDIAILLDFLGVRARRRPLSR